MNYFRQLSKVFLFPVLGIFFIGGIIWTLNTFDPIDILSYMLSFFILAGLSCFILSFVFKGKDVKSEASE